MSEEAHTFTPELATTSAASQTRVEGTGPADSSDEMVRRLGEIIEHTRQRAAARRRSRFLILALGGLMAAVSSFMLYRLSQQSRVLTPATLAQIARTEIEGQLPVETVRASPEYERTVTPRDCTRDVRIARG